MKKVFLFCLLSLTACASFGAFQFEYSATGNTSGGMAEYTLKILEGTGYIFLGKGLLRDGYAMGWYDVADGYTGATNEGYIMQDMTGKDRYSLGEFSAGDEVAIWFEFESIRGGSVIGTSTGESIGGTVTTAGSMRETDGIMVGRTADAFLYGSILEYGDNQTDIEAYGKIAFGFYGQESQAPSGQPLPGAIAVLVFGGSALAIRRRKAK